MKSAVKLKIIPLHTAASDGNFDLCKLIIDYVDDKILETLLEPHLFTKLPITVTLKCALIIDNLINKNPADIDRGKPFHLAALNGHFEICQLIADGVDDKNPADNQGITNFYIAAQIGNFDL